MNFGNLNSNHVQGIITCSVNGHEHQGDRISTWAELTGSRTNIAGPKSCTRGKQCNTDFTPNEAQYKFIKWFSLDRTNRHNCHEKFIIPSFFGRKAWAGREWEALARAKKLNDHTAPNEERELTDDHFDAGMGGQQRASNDSLQVVPSVNGSVVPAPYSSSVLTIGSWLITITGWLKSTIYYKTAFARWDGAFLALCATTNRARNSVICTLVLQLDNMALVIVLKSGPILSGSYLMVFEGCFQNNNEELRMCRISSEIGHRCWLQRQLNLMYRERRASFIAAVILRILKFLSV